MEVVSMEVVVSVKRKLQKHYVSVRKTNQHTQVDMVSEDLQDFVSLYEEFGFEESEIIHSDKTVGGASPLMEMYSEDKDAYVLIFEVPNA